MINISGKGINIILDGKIKRTPALRGYNSIETVRGVVKTEHTRGVVNIDIDITHIDHYNYEKLEVLFLSKNNKLEIEDIDRGVIYTNYYITGESLTLDEKEDLINCEYYYTGLLRLSKR